MTAAVRPGETLSRRYLVAVAIAFCAATAAGAAPRTEVFVIGSLYRQHESVPAYDLQVLRRIVLAIDPKVLVLDCTSDEIARRSVHASKIEYPGVIFPLMRERRYKVYAAEPDEPVFSEIVQSIVAAREKLAATRPVAAQALDQLNKATAAALAGYWQSPADVHDAITAQMLAGKGALQNRMIGLAAESGSMRWNQHWAEAILRAAAENPGQRILAITGIDNRSPIEQALKAADQIDLVDTTRWLRQHEDELRAR